MSQFNQYQNCYECRNIIESDVPICDECLYGTNLSDEAADYFATHPQPNLTRQCCAPLTLIPPPKIIQPEHLLLAENPPPLSCLVMKREETIFRDPTNSFTEETIFKCQNFNSAEFKEPILSKEETIKGTPNTYSRINTSFR